MKSEDKKRIEREEMEEKRENEEKEKVKEMYCFISPSLPVLFKLRSLNRKRLIPDNVSMKGRENNNSRRIERRT
jgi:hypothetical protein